MTRSIEFPYRGTIVRIGPKRLTIRAEDDGVNGRSVTRSVDPFRVQSVGSYYAKAMGQGPCLRTPVDKWGTFTRYLEVHVDLRPARQVDVFENGNTLRYDRSHWVDDYGILGDASIRRRHEDDPQRVAVEITSAAFESVWSSASGSSQWRLQQGTRVPGACPAQPPRKRRGLTPHGAGQWRLDGHR